MKRVLIRDDDVCYFTSPEILDRLYHRLLERSIPVNLSVIPKVSCTTPLPFGSDNPYFDGHLRYEPFIPPSFRGLLHSYEVGENGALVSYIGASPYLAPTQHGVTHDQADLSFLSGEAPLDFRQALLQGKAMLEMAFGESPTFFTPPWDRLSLPAMEVLQSEFQGVSAGFTRRRFLPVSDWGRYLLRRFQQRGLLRWKRCLLVTHPFDLSRFRFPNPRDLLPHIILALGQWDVLVLTNHYWEYLNDWSGWDQARLKPWDEVVSYLLAREDLKFETFTSLEMACRSADAQSKDSDRQDSLHQLRNHAKWRYGP